MAGSATILRADARALPLADASVDLIVTSPPYYGLRSYTDGGQHYDGQIGAEPTPAAYIDNLIGCTAEWMRVLKPSGSIFVNLGDKYAGAGVSGGTSKSTLAGASNGRPRDMREGTFHTGHRVATGAPAKSLLLLPERYRIACVDQLGLIARQVQIWSKPNGLPESVTDRTRRSHEDWVHLVKRPRYFAAVDEIRTPAVRDDARASGKRYGGEIPGIGRKHQGLASQPNHALGSLPGSVWEIPTEPLTVPDHLGVDHFAAFPTEWPRRIILGWSPSGWCTACGEARRPDAAKEKVGGWTRHTTSSRHREGSRSGGNEVAGSHVHDHVQVHITGYACACPDTTAPTRPAVVVDPFGGTGTTALVAKALGRRGISSDMSADYCRLATWRTTDPGELAKAMRVPKPPAQKDGQGDLFADLLEGTP